jgi:uncharacterized damage-inducible protein DinB
MQDIPDLLEGLKRSPRILTEFIRAVPEDKLHRRRGEGFWTIAEHADHLANAQIMLFDRLQRFMAEDHPVFTPFVPGNGEDRITPAPMETAAALDQFAWYRERQLLLLENADIVTWQKRATHPEYDHYSLHILVRHMLMHDFWHMYRMEELWLTGDAYLTKLT